jgi:hypothetical protein
MMIRFITVFMILGALTVALGCTIGIATGSKTIEGRPLLFKNKDTENDYPPDVEYYPGSAGEYSYVFQKTYGQDHTRARMGINSVGFGILYSDSENLPSAETGPTGTQLSAIALKTCASLDDFRALLDSTSNKKQTGLIGFYQGLRNAVSYCLIAERIDLLITSSAIICSRLVRT